MIRKTILGLLIVTCAISTLAVSGCGKRGNPFCSGCDMDDTPKKYPATK